MATPPLGVVGGVALLTAVFAAAVLTGCGSASRSTPARAALVTPLGEGVQAIPFAEVRHSVDALYERDPGILSYRISDVEYSARARDKVLHVCQSGGAASDEDALQSDKVMACAPLIYFFYSYGEHHAGSGSTAVAREVYDYSVTAINGPFNTQQTLNNLLRAWGIPVATTALPKASGPQAFEDALVNAAREAMLASRGVRITIAAISRSSHITSHAEFDSGSDTAAQTLTNGSAIGHLRVTTTNAYFSGNCAGLTNFFGMSANACQRIGPQWVRVHAGTSQYADFATGSFIGSVPATVLPATDAVLVTSPTIQGHRVYQLSWDTFGGTASMTPISRTLELTADGRHLPISETSTSKLGEQTVTFAEWGHAVLAAAPSASIPFASVTAGR